MTKVKNKWELGAYILLGVISIAVIVGIYIKSQSADLQKHSQLREQFSQFRQTDAVLNQHILEIRQRLLTNYDLVIKGLNELSQLSQQIQLSLKKLALTENRQNAEELQQNIRALNKVLDKKQAFLEIFKSKNALLQNSLLYLPLATAQLIHELPINKFTLKQTILLNAFLRNTLVYIVNADSALLETINKIKIKLQLSFKQTSKNLQQNLSILLAHASIVIKNKTTVDNYIQKILTLPTTQKLNALQNNYEQLYGLKLKQTKQYRQLLSILSLLLLITVAYSLFNLNRTRLRLRRSVNDLTFQKFAMDEHAIVSIMDKNGLIKYANKKFCQINQRIPKDLIGKNYIISKSDYHVPSFYKHMWNTIGNGNVWHGKVCNKAKNGDTYWLDSTIVPFMDENKQPYQYVNISTDITELKKTEEDLRIQSTALETVENGIIITNSDGIIQWVNDAVCRMTGYSQKELLGQSTQLLKSGKQDAAFYKNLWQTILTGQSWQGEMINKRKDGQLYTEEQTISPVHDDHGNIIRFIAVKQDISERKLQEEKIRHSQKMDALGQLTGGIAHDYNNMLGVVLGFTELLDTRISNSETDLKEYLQQILRAANRGAKLTHKLLDFSRFRGSDADTIDINALLQDYRNMLEKTLTARIKLELSLPNENWLIWLDNSDLEDAILNMCINSMHAISGNGKITLKVSNVHIEQPDAQYLEIKPADYIVLSITDNGCGMDEETKEKIFDPFYSTKGEKGNGLGLSQVYGFVERSHGAIKVYSEPGAGTQIVLYFPRYIENMAIQQSKQSSLNEKSGGTETILIVDDEPSLLKLTSEILNNQGYRTHTASSAKSALAILEKENIDLLLSDVIMPEMDGYELAAQVKQKFPHVKIQLASGFSDNQHLNLVDQELHKNLLHKPYHTQALLKQLRKILG